MSLKQDWNWSSQIGSNLLNLTHKLSKIEQLKSELFLIASTKY